MFHLTKNRQALKLILFLLILASYHLQGNLLVSQTAQDMSSSQQNFKTHDLIIIAFPVQGWYMVSVPVTVTDNSVSTLFPMATSALAWENEQYVSVSTIETGKGYWFYIPQPSTAIISGTAISQFSAHYTPGWQLIGSVLDKVDLDGCGDKRSGLGIVEFHNG